MRGDNIYQGGEINVRPMTGSDGRTYGGDVYLHANDGLHVAGSINANGDHGGYVQLRGDRVNVTSTVDVSGVDAGGEIDVGRTGYPGATYVNLADGAVLRANARTADENGAGSIEVDAVTIRFGGHVEAKNSHQSGVGGSATMAATSGFYMDGGTSDLSGGAAAGSLDIYTKSASICSGQADDCSGKNKFKDVDVAAVLAKNDLLIASVHEWRTDYNKKKGSVYVDEQAQVSWDSANRLSLHADRDMNVSGGFEAERGTLEMQVGDTLTLSGGVDSVRDVGTVKLVGEYQGYPTFYPRLQGPDQATVWDIGSDAVTMDGVTMGISNIGQFLAGNMGDTFNINDGSDSPWFLVKGGDGDDIFNLNGVIEDIAVRGGSGEDVFTVNGSVSGLSILAGGHGSDLYVLNGTMDLGSCIVDTGSRGSADVYRLGGTMDHAFVYDYFGNDEYTLEGTITNESEIKDYRGDDSYRIAGTVNGESTINDDSVFSSDSYTISGSISGAWLEDSGGDDTYVVTAAGVVDGQSAVEDYGSGDDSYTISGSIRGMSLLEDYGGDDTYVVTAAGAIDGQSRVWDRSGNDSYTISGSLSDSVLRDFGGNDTYTVSGSIRSGSTLRDFGGNDTYTVSGSIGGVSELRDSGGSDSYTIDGVIEGSSTIHDQQSGDDSYTIAGSIRDGGALYDAGGDDTYMVTASGSIDRGLISDASGSDTYSVYGSISGGGAISDGPFDSMHNDGSFNSFNLYGSMDGNSRAFFYWGGEDSIRVGADAVVSDGSSIVSWNSDSSNFVIDGTVTSGAILAALSTRGEGVANFELNGTLSGSGAALLAYTMHGNNSFVINGTVDGGVLASGLSSGSFLVNEGGTIEEGSKIRSESHHFGSYDDTFVMNGTFNGGTVDLGSGTDTVTIGGTVAGGSMDVGIGADVITFATGSRLQGGSILSGSGDDTLVINGDISGGSVSTADGSDSITINGTVTGGTVDTDAGADVITFATGSRLQGGSILSGIGDDTLVMNGDISGGSVSAASGSDSITINGTVTGGTVDAGIDSDRIIINHRYTAGIMEAGRGNDYIRIEDTGTIAGGSIRGNEGHDVFEVHGNVNGTGILAGGAGSDGFVISGTVSGNGSIYGGANHDAFVMDPSGSVIESGSLHGGRSGSDFLSFNSYSSGVDIVVDGITVVEGGVRGFSGSATNVAEFNGMDIIIGSTSSNEDSISLPSRGQLDSVGRGGSLHVYQEQWDLEEGGSSSIKLSLAAIENISVRAADLATGDSEDDSIDGI